MSVAWLVVAAQQDPPPTDQPAGSGSWQVAAIGLAGVLLGSIIAALFTARRERVARREESQRKALYELQEAALTLRRALEGYDPDAHGAKTTEATEALDDAAGKLEMIKHRIICETVRDRVDDWAKVAQAYYLGDQSVTFAQTDAAWKQLQIDIGKELRRLA